MKNLALSFLAIALIAGAPLAAQSEPTPLNNPPVQEERTNPDAASITGDSGLTVTGTVVSFTDTALVLDTAAGQHTIQLTPQTTRPVSFTTGEKVAVDYTRNSTGVMIATAVRQEGTASADADHSMHTDPSTATAAPAAPETNLQNEPEPDVTASAEVEANVDADLDTDVEADVDAYADADTDSETLPETGSEAPLAGLMGLLALLAATVLRSRKA